jgi:SAM-dependent methyltransferase
LDYDRIYAYRFRGVDPRAKIAVWAVLSRWLAKKLGNPSVVLDPAAGACEFINTVPVKERWAVDMGGQVITLAGENVRAFVGSIADVDLPAAHFEGVFVSNFLEHLPDPEACAKFLERMHALLVPGGRIVVMGPNFRCCPREYFDFADHTLILTEKSAVEHLYAAGFEIVEVHARFLPLSFRGRIPARAWMVSAYLALPFAWRLLGKQFLLVAQKPRVSSAPVSRIS